MRNLRLKDNKQIMKKLENKRKKDLKILSKNNEKIKCKQMAKVKTI